MKKKLSFLLLALVTVAAFAVQTARRAAAASEAESATVKTWEQASSIAVNDIVLFTNISAKKELKAIELFGSNSVGSTEDYTENIPAGVYPLTVVAGSTDGTIAFKTSDNKYLAWAAGNTLSAADAVDANSSWTVTFEGTTPTIVNGADASRKLQYNSGNPRFATYTSSQTAIDIWKQVEKEAPAVEAPVITVADNFEETTPVTITCATDGATIYYTLDGKEPTAESTQYTESFNLDKTAVIKAIAIKGENKSSITEKKTYCSKIADLATLNDYPNAYSFTFTGEALVVAKPTASYVYVKDSKASSLIYHKEGTLTAAAEVGKTIAANWTGKVSFYNKLFEAVPDAALVMKEGDAAKVTYPTVDASYITAEHINEVVTLKGVTYTKGSGKNLTFAKGEATVAGYNQFGLTIDDPAEGKIYDIVGAIGRYNDNIQFQPIEIIAFDDIVIAPASGDISAALATAIEGKNVGRITINLTKDAAYTVSAPIVAPNSLVINGNGATIDASANEGVFVQMPETPTVEANAKSAYIVDGVTIKDVTIKGIKNSLFWDSNKKYGLAAFTIDNAVIELAQTAVKNESVIAFQAGGAKDFTIKNSTVYSSNEPLAKYFLRYNNNGRLDNLGYDKNTELQNYNYVGNTFYKVLKSDGQWGNGPNGQKFQAYDVEKNIWYNCGKDIIRRLLNGRANGSNPMTFAKNTYFNNYVDISSSEASYDKSGDILTTNPNFKNVAQFDFTLEATSAQATNQTGDPRWNATPYTGLAITIAEGIANGTVAVSQDKAAEGTVVTIIATPAAGYEIETLTAKDADGADVTVSGVKFTMPAKAVTVTATFIKQPVDITITAAEIADNDITAALAAKVAAITEAGDRVGKISITLAEGNYKVTAPIVAPNSLEIDGNGATIDASALDKAFIQLSTEPTVSFLPKNDGSGNTDYYGVDEIDISGVKVTGLKTSIFYDNNKKYCVDDFTIDNCVFALATESVNNEALIAFQAGGAKDFKVKNSTIYGNNAVAKYFVRYNNSARIDRYGFLGADDTWSFTYENNTFYGLLKSDGQWGNYGGIAGSGKEKVGILTIKNNIWVNCDPQTMRRLISSKNFSAFNAASAMENNIFNLEGAVVDQGNYSNGSDLAGIVTFEDAAAGKFGGNVELPYGVEKPAAQPGDARWTLTYTNAPQKFAINLTAVENGTVAVDATGNQAEGTIITITATPNEGYELDAITVTGVYSNVAVVVTDGKFTMPADDVTVTVTFKVSTGIQNVSVENNSLENATIYDLNGRRVENPTKKGIYIVNGKKVVIK